MATKARYRIFEAIASKLLTGRSTRACGNQLQIKVQDNTHVTKVTTGDLHTNYTYNGCS